MISLELFLMEIDMSQEVSFGIIAGSTREGSTRRIPEASSGEILK